MGEALGEGKAVHSYRSILCFSYKGHLEWVLVSFRQVTVSKSLCSCPDEGVLQLSIRDGI